MQLGPEKPGLQVHDWLTGFQTPRPEQDSGVESSVVQMRPLSPVEAGEFETPGAARAVLPATLRKVRISMATVFGDEDEIMPPAPPPPCV